MADVPHEWLVPHDLPAFAGHFPGRPIVPGVVLLDRVVQVASTSSAATIRIDSAKFVRPVGPGELLRFELVRKPTGGVSFTVLSGGVPVALGSLIEVVA